MPAWVVIVVLMTAAARLLLNGVVAGSNAPGSKLSIELTRRRSRIDLLRWIGLLQWTAVIVWTFGHCVSVFAEPQSRQRLVSGLSAWNTQIADELSEKFGTDERWIPMVRVGYGLWRAIDDVEVWILIVIALCGGVMHRQSVKLDVQEGRVGAFSLAKVMVAVATILSICAYLDWVSLTEGTLAYIANIGAYQYDENIWLKYPVEFLKGATFVLVLGCNGVVCWHGLDVLAAIDRVSSTDRQMAADHLSVLLSIGIQPLVTTQLFYIIFLKLLSAPIVPVWSMTGLQEASGLALATSLPYLVLALSVFIHAGGRFYLVPSLLPPPIGRERHGCLQ